MNGRWVRLLGVVGVVLLAAGIALAAKGDKNATGTIRTSNVGMSVRVDGRVEDGYLWLGFTFIREAGLELDAEVIKVKKGFKKDYFVGTGEAVTKGRMKYVASLWRWKVSKKECTRGPCKWCKKNGYHMQDRVASSSGTWRPK